MLGDILGEIVSAVVGDALLGWLWPQRPTQPWPPPEGQWNASLGSIAAFLGGVSALFVGTATLVLVQGRRDEDVPLLVLLAIGFGCAFLGSTLARRTFTVTPRRHHVAAIGLWCSRASIMSGVVALLVLLSRVGL
jgi:hypothetical protein